MQNPPARMGYISLGPQDAVSIKIWAGSSLTVQSLPVRLFLSTAAIPRLIRFHEYAGPAGLHAWDSDRMRDESPVLQDLIECRPDKKNVVILVCADFLTPFPPPSQPPHTAHAYSCSAICCTSVWEVRVSVNSC